jgi:dTDP-4-dehydrorhamnose reductase
VRLFADQVVSPTLADSLADMLLDLVADRLGGLWNLSGAEPVDRVTFGERLCEAFGFDRRLIEPVSLRDVPLASPRPRYSGLDTAKAAARLAHKPLDVDASLRALRASYEGTDSYR